MKLLVIGYGNPARGDDAVGYLAAETLRARNTDPEIEILAVQQLLPELIEPVHQASRVVFIDAACGETPGEIRRRPLQPDGAAGGLTHHVTPEALLAGARALYGAAPSATLITITAASMEFGEPLSAPVRNALDGLTATFTGL